MNGTHNPSQIVVSDEVFRLDFSLVRLTVTRFGPGYGQTVGRAGI